MALLGPLPLMAADAAPLVLASLRHDAMKDRSEAFAPLADERPERLVPWLSGHVANENVLLWLPTVAVLHRQGFTASEEFAKTWNQIALTGFPDDPMLLIDALAQTPFLSGPESFDPIHAGPAMVGDDSVWEHFIGELAKQPQDYRDVLATTLERWQSARQSFGAMLLLGRLAQFAPDMQIALHPFDGAFAATPDARRPLLLAVLRKLWSDFDDKLMTPEVQTDLPGLAALVAREADAKIIALLAAKSVRDVAALDTEVESRFVNTFVQVLPHSEGKATEVLLHGIALIEEAQRAGTWTGTRFGNGFNSQSDMLWRVCQSYHNQVLQGTMGKVPLTLLRVMARVCDTPDQRTSFYPYPFWEPRWGDLLHTHWERAGGYADPREATRDLLVAVKQAMGDTSVVTLAMPFSDFGSKLPRWYAAIVRDEASRLAQRDVALQAVAMELVTGIAVATQDKVVMEHLQARLNDETLNVLLRAELAALLCGAVNDVLEPKVMQRCMESVLPLLEADGPGTSALWENVIGMFNRQPPSAKWEQLAARFRQAWMRRARFNKQDGQMCMGLRPFRTSCLHVLDTFARSGNADDMKVFADLFADDYHDYPAARLVLARHGSTQALQDVMQRNGGLAQDVDESPTIAFRESDLKALSNVDVAIESPSLALLARVQMASVRDSVWQAPSKSRVDRLADEASRLLAVKDLDEQIEGAVEPVLFESFDAARVLALRWLSRHDFAVEFTAACKADRDERRKLLQATLSVALARLCDGDGTSWAHCMQVLSEHREESLLSDVSYLAGLCCTQQMRAHGFEHNGWIAEVAQGLIELVPDTMSSNPAEAIANVWLVRCLLTNDLKALDAWWQSLSDTRQEQLSSSPNAWLLYGLVMLPLVKGEDGMDSLLAILRNPWASKLLACSSDLSYRGELPQRFNASDLRAKTQVLLKTAPGVGALTISVMNAWANVQDQSPLFEAMKSIKLDEQAPQRVQDYVHAVLLEAARKH
jgi:hypothetical protein